MPRPLLLVTVALTLAAASLASLPTPTPTRGSAALDVRRRFVEPSACCEADPDMCRPGTVRTALTRGDVLRVVALHRDEARSCLHGSTVARARVRWRVGADGRATDVVLVDKAGDGIDDGAARCLVGAVQAWRFPTTPDGLRAPITFAFSGPRAATR